MRLTKVISRAGILGLSLLTETFASFTNPDPSYGTKNYHYGFNNATGNFVSFSLIARILLNPVSIGIISSLSCYTYFAYKTHTSEHEQKTSFKQKIKNKLALNNHSEKEIENMQDRNNEHKSSLDKKDNRKNRRHLTKKERKIRSKLSKITKNQAHATLLNHQSEDIAVKEYKPFQELSTRLIQVLPYTNNPSNIEQFSRSPFSLFSQQISIPDMNKYDDLENDDLDNLSL